MIKMKINLYCVHYRIADVEWKLNIFNSKARCFRIAGGKILPYTIPFKSKFYFGLDFSLKM